jgi:hypothetical protein
MDGNQAIGADDFGRTASDLMFVMTFFEWD